MPLLSGNEPILGLNTYLLQPLGNVAESITSN
jgi:hypothetical protein